MVLLSSIILTTLSIWDLDLFGLLRCLGSYVVWVIIYILVRNRWYYKSLILQPHSLPLTNERNIFVENTQWTISTKVNDNDDIKAEGNNLRVCMLNFSDEICGNNNNKKRVNEKPHSLPFMQIISLLRWQNERGDKHRKCVIVITMIMFVKCVLNVDLITLFLCKTFRKTIRCINTLPVIFLLVNVFPHSWVA